MPCVIRHLARSLAWCNSCCSYVTQLAMPTVVTFCHWITLLRCLIHSRLYYMTSGYALEVIMLYWCFTIVLTPSWWGITNTIYLILYYWCVFSFWELSCQSNDWYWIKNIVLVPWMFMLLSFSITVASFLFQCCCFSLHKIDFLVTGCDPTLC